MLRDTEVSDAEVTSWMDVLTGTAIRHVSGMDRDQVPAAARKLADAIRLMWEAVPPEPVRNVMVDAADLVFVTSGDLPAGIPFQSLMAIKNMLDVMRQEPQPGKMRPVVAFASSLAFDHEDDELALNTLAALLALAYAGSGQECSG